jgi:hypothetical protein
MNIQPTRLAPLNFAQINTPAVLIWCGEPTPGQRKTPKPATFGIGPFSGMLDDYQELRLFFADRWIHFLEVDGARSAVEWTTAMVAGARITAVTNDVFLRKDWQRFGVAKPSEKTLQLVEYRQDGRVLTWRLQLAPPTASADQSEPRA